jgi:hypothetical protein
VCLFRSVAHLCIICRQASTLTITLHRVAAIVLNASLEGGPDAIERAATILRSLAFNFPRQVLE